MKEKTTGGVSIKKINGQTYYYFQWCENGKRRSHTISEEEYYSILNQKQTSVVSLEPTRFMGIKMLSGKELLQGLSYVSNWNKRDLFSSINEDLNSPLDGKVLVLYGLRRTGKTTLMFQSILNHQEDIDKTAYLSVDDRSNMGELNIILDDLAGQGYKYIYIDEITKLNDFISSSQFLSDIYAFKMKVVLSEFSRVLGINDIDKYIEYGGTLVVEGINYHLNVAPTFYDKASTVAYIDTAISRNIQRSLSNYRDGDNFTRLKELKDKGELTNLINRVIQDNNHRFTKEVINRTFKSQDYGSLKELMRKNKKYDELRTFFDNLDEEKIYVELMNRIDVSNENNVLDDETLEELYRYLKMLDVIDTVDEVDIETGRKKDKIVIVQPGLRYSLAKELIQSLMKEESIIKLPEVMSNFIFETLLNDVKGRLLEEITLLFEKRVKKSIAFKPSFTLGEYDMAVYNPVNNSFSLFEIKHSFEKDENQLKHLIDKQKLDLMEYRYGHLDNRVVLYRGEDDNTQDIKYWNIEKYLS